ncbi:MULTISPECIES: LLM class flavin-dependent oxidoreductase [Cryobacterium]|uniref:LLM class flavin-dependent oxidoreductase n=1 Tax=Cryobacterium TaxID=69578 RepID=UPI000CD46624|nr:MULTISPECIES: LLM class flavin-dependent oxidoreductase [Cryobacterium]POH63221.1 LLM class flavin-dependent oxidoreductase [Cryobacterium zongtaii]TFC43658.1 LLM class flavin-dependent oxidoreductase [Cryobacterium sp. TMN-39-2]
MQLGPPSGTAPFALSVLASGGTGVGTTAEEGLTGTIALARTADRRGFHRFWMSEHHAMGAPSVSSPPLMIARLIAETARIRLGAGGVMLPNHAPLLIAEQFGMLDAMAPGRIDLGLGRAPGTDGATAEALRRGADGNDRFPQQVLELLGFLGDEFPPGHQYRAVHAVPGPWQAAQNRVPAPSTRPEVWVLGSSPYSARLAAQLGRPYAFALQFGDADIDTALRLYRDEFQPSDLLAEPRTLVSVPVAISDDAAEAKRQAATSAMAMLRMFKREGYLLLPPDEVEAYPATTQERQVLDAYTNRSFHGTPTRVADRLEALQERTGVDEVTLVVSGHSAELDRRGLELIADHYDLSRV